MLQMSVSGYASELPRCSWWSCSVLFTVSCGLCMRESMFVLMAGSCLLSDARLLSRVMQPKVEGGLSTSWWLSGLCMQGGGGLCVVRDQLCGWKSK